MTNPAQGKDGDTMSVGRQTSGQEGATPSRESQQETGGNGGAGLTRNQAGPDVNAPDGDEGLVPLNSAPGTGSVDAAMTHSNAGAQDTRSDQAGRKDTGLGARETGANQTEDDLPSATP